MHGYQITFFTQQNRMHRQRPLAQWLLGEAKKLGFHGATLSGALQGFGHDGTMHETNLFDVSDQPILVTIVLVAEDVDRLFAHLAHEQVQVFYLKHPVEFGALGSP